MRKKSNLNTQTQTQAQTQNRNEWQNRKLDKKKSIMGKMLIKSTSILQSYLVQKWIKYEISNQMIKKTCFKKKISLNEKMIQKKWQKIKYPKPTPKYTLYIHETIDKVFKEINHHNIKISNIFSKKS